MKLSNIRMMWWALAIAIAVAVVVVLAVVDGQGRPRESEGIARIEGIDPCGLLTPAQAGQFGVGGGTRADLDNTRVCQWYRPGLAVDVGLDGRHGIAAVKAGQGSASAIMVGRHRAVRIVANAGPGVCAVSIAVTDSSRADIVAAATDGTGACGVADLVAGYVEPRLP